MLTPKQEAFCLAYVETGNASEAYRQAYSAANMKAETIANNAHALLKRSDITARLAALRAPAIHAAQATLEQHLQDLKRLRDAAEAAQKFGPAIQAEIARGKACGFYVERVDVSPKQTAPVLAGLEHFYASIVETNRAEQA